MRCEACKGTGKRDRMSFVDYRKTVKIECEFCHGAGEIETQEERDARVSADTVARIVAWLKSGRADEYYTGTTPDRIADAIELEFGSKP